MPEYLAPGVYVEEIDTGSKPIEGVSTSTAGMLGVTERGPVNMPILITGFGEYQRWFGQYLRLDDFSTNNRQNRHCYLPHAVEGFFANGGKRVFVVRVLDVENARSASTLLFDRGSAVSSNTQLLASSATGDVTTYVLDDTGLVFNSARPAWLQIGDGSGAEYVQLANVPNPRFDVPLGLPLANAYPIAGTSVERLDTPDNAKGPHQLQGAVATGTMSIVLDAVGAGASALAAGDLLRIGAADAPDEEYVFIDSVAGTTVTLRTPLLFAHADQAAVSGSAASGLTAHDAAILHAGYPVSPGSAVVFLEDRTHYTTAGDFLRLTSTDPVTHVAQYAEVRRIGTPSQTALTAPAYAGIRPAQW